MLSWRKQGGLTTDNKATAWEFQIWLREYIHIEADDTLEWTSIGLV